MKYKIASSTTIIGHVTEVFSWTLKWPKAGFGQTLNGVSKQWISPLGLQIKLEILRIFYLTIIPVLPAPRLIYHNKGILCNSAYSFLYHFSCKWKGSAQKTEKNLKPFERIWYFQKLFLNRWFSPVKLVGEHVKMCFPKIWCFAKTEIFF